jgi:O-antigen/teichoic acid export membrane protein
VLVFAIMGYGAYSLIFGSIITGFLKFVLACLWNFWIPKLQFQTRGLKSFIKFGSAVIIDRILWYLYSNSDYMILAKKLGAVPFGYYSYAFNFASMPTTKIQPIIFPVLYSSFSMIQDDHEQLREQYLKIINYAFKIYVMIFCGMFWVSREFVSLFLGSKWEPIILVLQILLIIQPLRGVSSIGPALINALGKPQVTAKNMFIFVSIMVPSFLFGSKWGMTGVAAMWCIAYPVAYMITLTISLRVAQIPLKQYFSQLVPGFRLALVASVFLYAFSRLVPYFFFTTNANILCISFVGKILLGTISYLVVLWIFDRSFIRYVLSYFKKQSNDNQQNNT